MTASEDNWTGGSFKSKQRTNQNKAVSSVTAVSQVYSCLHAFGSSKMKNSTSQASNYQDGSPQKTCSIRRHTSFQGETDHKTQLHKDYQDVWKNRQRVAKGAMIKRSESAKSTNTDATVKATMRYPAVPSKHYTEYETLTSSLEDQTRSSLDPPLIAFRSGSLPRNASQSSVVRPIAFKPVQPSKTASYAGSPDPVLAQMDDGYSSQSTSRSCSQSAYLGLANLISSQMTPSPSEALVADLEQVLRDKEEELATLRLTIECNERAIFRVQEERRKMWEAQMGELANEYHRRLRFHKDLAEKSEHDARLCIMNLQKETQGLIHERDRLCGEGGALSNLKQEVDYLRRINDDLSQKVTSAMFRNESLHLQQKEDQNIIEALREKTVMLREENLKLQNNLLDANRYISSIELESHKQSPSYDELSRELENRELEIQVEREQFENERHNWSIEKEKVLKYQRQLQVNYVRMVQRNRELEDELKQVDQYTSHSSAISPEHVFKLQLLESNQESFC